MWYLPLCCSPIALVCERGKSGRRTGYLNLFTSWYGVICPQKIFCFISRNEQMPTANTILGKADSVNVCLLNVGGCLLNVRMLEESVDNRLASRFPSTRPFNKPDSCYAMDSFCPNTWMRKCTRCPQHALAHPLSHTSVDLSLYKLKVKCSRQKLARRAAEISQDVLPSARGRTSFCCEQLLMCVLSALSTKQQAHDWRENCE